MTEIEQIVTPFETKTNGNQFNYQRLIEKFGVSALNQEHLDRIRRLTGCEPHPWLKRGIFFAHRQLDEILDDFEQGKKFFLYTGRGPTSESLHLGHMLPFEFCAWFQHAFDVPIVIQMSDDEKYFFKDMPFEEIYRLGFENAKDIIACGFKPEKTFIFSNRDYSPYMYPIVCEINKHVNFNMVKGTFGFTDSSTIGQILWPTYQAAAAFSGIFPSILGPEKMKCLVAYAIDQDPYFRMARDVAPKIDHSKPCSIMSKFLIALTGDEKMSTTGISPTIYMTDTREEIEDKIMRYALSGGGSTLQEHRENGADLTSDVSFEYLRHFEMDDNVLNQIADAYSSGTMTTKEIKNI